MVAALLIGYLLCPTPISADNSTRALVFHFRTYDPETRCEAAVEGQVDESLQYWDILDPYVLRQTDLEDEPAITIDMLRVNLSGRRVALLSTHGAFGEPDVMAGEYYLSQGARDVAFDAYVNGPVYGFADLQKGRTLDGAYTIDWTNAGIAGHLQTMAENAIVHGDYCDSYYLKDDWNVDTYIGYEYWMGASYACDNLKKVWTRLGCQWAWDGSGWPFFGHQTDDAVRGLPGIGLWPSDSKNQLDLNRGCHNIATTFEGVGLFGDTFYWRTLSEVGSIDFVVRGYPLSGSPDTVAVIPADGGYGILRTYWIEGVGGFESYDVVERDDKGRWTISDRVRQRERPSQWNDWISNPRIDIDAEVIVHKPSILYEWIKGTLVPVGDISGVDAANRPRERAGSYLKSSPPPDSTNCADAVIYSSVADFIDPAYLQLTSGTGGTHLKVRAFVGGTDPSQARLAYSLVLAANQAYEDLCAQGGGCDRHFPVDPGPLLEIVGDAQPLVVYPMMFGDEYERCYRDSCRSDYDIVDVDNDGSPDGPVTRIPGSNLDEIEKASSAAWDFNDRVSLDPGWHLITFCGDLYDAAQDTTLIPVELLTGVQQVYSGMGYTPRPMLRGSDYPYEGGALHEAARQQINQGALELWGFDLDVGDPWTWPGFFLSQKYGSDYPESLLTTQQRFVAYLPSCHIGAVDKDLRGIPIVEQLMFNDPDKTMLAGCVAHWEGGWNHQHEMFSEILLQARENAGSHSTVASIAHQAVRDCQDQFPWMFDYARSVAVLGAYVRPVGGLGAVDDGPQTVNSSASMRLSAVGNPGSRPQLRFSLPEDARVDLAIYDVRGRLVSRITNARLPAGDHQYLWYGMDRNGSHVASGVYFARLEIRGPNGPKVETAKVVITR